MGRLHLLPHPSRGAQERRGSFKSARPRPPLPAGSEFQEGGAETAGGRGGRGGGTTGIRGGSVGASPRRPDPAPASAAAMLPGAAG